MWRNRPSATTNVQCQPGPPPLTATLYFRDPPRLDQCQFRQQMNANATAPHGRSDSLSRYDNYDEGVSNNDDDDRNNVIVDDDDDDDDNGDDGNGN